MIGNDAGNSFFKNVNQYMYIVNEKHTTCNRNIQYLHMCSFSLFLNFNDLDPAVPSLFYKFVLYNKNAYAPQSLQKDHYIRGIKYFYIIVGQSTCTQFD